MNQDSFQPQLTPEFVIRALDLKQTASSTPFTEVSTDSRKIKPGCLFVPLAGEKFDGHDFARQALAQGAAGLICRKDFNLGTVPNGAQVFRVDDTLEAFRTLAARWRREFSIPVIVVAGSNGKTTTKELLAAILGGRWLAVLKTTGSQNGFVGIPITLLELNRSHGAAVIEVGIDEMGAMAKHIRLVAGTCAILTSISHEHLEKLRDLETIASEEGQAFTLTRAAGGLCVVNLDDPWLEPQWSKLSGAKRAGFTLRPSAASCEDEIFHGAVSASGDQLEVRGSRDFPPASFPLPLPGAHNAANLLGAIAVAASLGLSADEIRRGLATFRGAGGRSDLRRLADGTEVLCDYYNANPSSTLAGIAVLNGVAARTRRARWLCLADMLELGVDEESFHRGLAPAIADAGIEHVLLYGERMHALEDELRKLGVRGEVAHFDSQEKLAEALAANAQPGDAVMIKGSHSMRMEKVWEYFRNARGGA